MILLLDPAVIAVPPAPTPECRFLEHLHDWLEVLRAHRGMACVHRESTYALMEESRYPDHVALESYMSKKGGCETISLQDIRRLLALLSETEPYLEHFVDLPEVEVGSKIKVEPDLSGRLSEKVLSLFLQALIQVACAEEMDKETDSVAIASGPSGFGVSLRLVANVTVALRDDVALEAFDVDKSFGLYDMASQCEPNQICITVDNPDESVLFALNKLGLPKEGRVWSFQTGFVPSLIEAGFRASPPLLDKVFRFIALALHDELKDVKGAKLRAVRVSEAADAEQERRDDGSRRWRCTLTTSGAGFRLQFWKGPGGELEIEPILKKEDTID